MGKRYYWLRMKEDFFSSKRIKKLRKLAGGDTYTIIYLKMQLLSLKKEGVLEYTGLESSFAEELALDLDESVDNVQVTLQYLSSCGLIETSDNVNFLLPFAVENIGCETAAAQRMRDMRKRNNVTPMLQMRYGEKEIEKEKRDREEIELELEKDIIAQSSDEPSQKHKAKKPEENPFITLSLNTGEEYPVYPSDISQYKELYPAVDIEQQLRSMKGWCMSNPTKRKTKKGIKRFIDSWLSREQDKFHPSNGRNYRPTPGEVLERAAQKYRSGSADNIVDEKSDNDLPFP